MKFILKLFFLSFFPLPGISQDITGTWNGKLELPQGTELTLTYHIKDSLGILRATMDSPDQSAFGIEAEEVTFLDGEIKINGPMDIRFEGKIEDTSTISGTFFQKGFSFPLRLGKGEVEQKRPQEPKPPFPYKIEEITFRNPSAGGIKLAGTLTLPDTKDKFPVVVLITGSGPQDRDETLMGHKPFWVIADYLARRGIGVLRFDDRGTGQSEGDFGIATTADFATDVASAVEYLRSRKDVNLSEIGLIGHSEGTIVASMVASKDVKIGFIILLAGPGVKGADLLAMQNRAIGKAQGLGVFQLNYAEQINRDLYNTVIQAKNDSSMRSELERKLSVSIPENVNEEKKEEIIRQNIEKLTTPWMKYFLKDDPSDYLSKVCCPVLALNGSKDLQVPARENLNAIRNALMLAGNEKVTIKNLPGLNHLFQEADSGLPDEYGRIEQTISPEVLDIIGNWIDGVADLHKK